MSEAEYKSSDLIDAIRTRDRVKADTLIKNGCDIDAQDTHGDTALMWAIFKGFNSIVDLLLQRGAKFTSSHKGNTPMICAVTNRRLCIVKTLVSREKVNTPNLYGSTPLMFAAMMGDNEITEILLQSEDTCKSIPWCNKKGWTALILAAKGGHKRIVELLLHRNEGRESVTRKTNWGDSAIMWATVYKNTEIAKLLFTGYYHKETLFGSKGYTLLMMAAKHGEIEIAELILAHKVGKEIINLKNDVGETALDFAKTPEIHDLLVRHGACGTVCV